MMSSQNPMELHKQAAKSHEEAAQHHHKAAACHEQNKPEDAMKSAKNATECCDKAHQHTAAACRTQGK